MSKILVFGHQSPDTDTIASAISLAYLANELSYEAEAVALGKVNAETKFSLDYFGFQEPRIVERVADEVEKVILVDHNESQQSVPDLDRVSIKAVVDHHRIANFKTSDPLYYRAEPLGSTASILTKLYKEKGIIIPKDIAGLMLSALISDTLLLKSPTTTDEDRQIADELAEIAGVSLNEYGLEMLKAGTDISDKTALQILNDDAKSFTMGNDKVRIGQVNVVDINELLFSRKDELVKAMHEEIKNEGYSLFVLMITDIIRSNSVAIVEGEEYRKFERAFNKSIQMGTVELENVVSRKKQLVPPLTDIFTQ
ncbi:MAG: manganese-dependent inorganic pyrophosphatase [Atopostipes suicloacalis]|nr:manganese-dependent inorganic pyrophosphatase [Atopostipes suicloacalis]